MRPLDDGFLYGYFCKPSRVGCSHSYTARETRSIGKVQQYVLLAKLRGETLTDYTKPDWYYCIVEDGSIFKYHPEECIFYQLDLERFVWVSNQHFVSIVYDTILKYQEISGFQDYFPNDVLTENDNK